MKQWGTSLHNGPTRYGILYECCRLLSSLVYGMQDLPSSRCCMQDLVRLAASAAEFSKLWGYYLSYSISGEIHSLIKADDQPARQEPRTRWAANGTLGKSRGSVVHKAPNMKKGHYSKCYYSMILHNNIEYCVISILKLIIFKFSGNLAAI